MRFSLLLLAVILHQATACTVALAGRKATEDGSTLLFHADDCGNCDFRLGRVHPARADEPASVLRFRPEYPREVSDRSSTYSIDNLDPELPQGARAAWSSPAWVTNQTIGSFNSLEPKLAAALGITIGAGDQTYGTLEGLYSIINSKQVTMAETTGSSHPSLFNPSRPHAVPGQPLPTGADGALWDVSALSKVALRLCPTARCAVDLMGYLAVRDGFYGQYGLPTDASYGGEIMLVADPTEAWAFHVVPVPPAVQAGAALEPTLRIDGHSAAWVAQRVPDDHFIVGANRAMIRDVVEEPSDPTSDSTRACRGETYRHSCNLFPLADYLSHLHGDRYPLEDIPSDQRGVRTTGTRRVVDFLTTFSGEKVELASYSNDRVWRVLSLWAPEMAWPWPPQTPLATRDYPFSAKPSRPLTRADFLKVARDVYRGAPEPSLDLTRGAASGWGGDPTRHDVNATLGNETGTGTPNWANGSFPRAISMFRTSYSHVTEIGRPNSHVIGGRIWATQGAPHAAIYSPLHALPAALAAPSDPAADGDGMVKMPRSFTTGSLHRADALDASPENASVFWRTTAVNNWARAVGYDLAWAIIEATQADVEAQADAEAAAAERDAERAPSPTAAAALLAAADASAARRAANRHRQLLGHLMTKLHDGYNVATDAEGVVALTTFAKANLFYPKKWLEHVGYYKPNLYPCKGQCVAPPSGDDMESKAKWGADHGLRASTPVNAVYQPVGSSSAPAAAVPGSAGMSLMALSIALTLAVSMSGALGYALGTRKASRRALAATELPGDWPAAEYQRFTH